jgi:hypothetical protein
MTAIQPTLNPSEQQFSRNNSFSIPQKVVRHLLDGKTSSNSLFKRCVCARLTDSFSGGHPGHRAETL